MARGRKKKDILEEEELNEWNEFQNTLRKNAEWIKANDKLNDKEQKFLDAYLAKSTDTKFDLAKKMVLFKHYVLKKCLSQEDCTYLIDVDSKGTKPSEKHKLTKMAVCKIENRACMKLRKAFGSKFNIYKLDDVIDTTKNRSQVSAMSHFGEIEEAD